MSSRFYLLNPKPCPSDSHVVVAGSEHIYVTKDGGNSWNYTNTSEKWGSLPYFGFKGPDIICKK